MEETTTKENQIYATDYVDGKEMAASTQEKLAEFVKYENLAEWTKLAHEGKSKFYDFIREAYAQGNIYVAWEEFSTTVNNINANLSKELVKDYFRKYQKGIELLLLAI